MTLEDERRAVYLDYRNGTQETETCLTCLLAFAGVRGRRLVMQWVSKRYGMWAKDTKTVGE